MTMQNVVNLFDGSVRGCIEHINDRTIIGWAWDESAPNVHVYADFVLGGQTIGSSTCNIVRQDLKQAGIGNGDHGFSWEVPSDIATDKIPAIEVQIRTDVVNPKKTTSRSVKMAKIEPIRREETADDFQSNLNFVWPYFLSGSLVGSQLIETLDLVVDGKTLLRIPTTVCEDLESSDFGRTIFAAQLGADGEMLPAGDYALLINGRSHIALGAQGSHPARKKILSSSFALNGNKLTGQIRTAPDFPAETLTLKIVIGTNVAQILKVTRQPGSAKFEFSLTLNAKPEYFKGDDLPLGVSIAELGEPLLAKGKATLAFSAGIVSNLEKWSGVKILGWVANLRQPEQPLNVQLFDGATLIAQATPNVKRLDVCGNFKIKGNHGFELVVPESLYDGHKLNLRVVCEGVELREGAKFAFPSQLTTDDLNKIEPAHRYSGRVEIVTTGMVTGWVCDDLRADSPVDLTIKADGRCLGAVRANRFSARLRTSARSGHHAFQFELPDSLMDGKKHEITVHVSANDYALPNKLNPVLFPLTRLPDASADSKSRWNYRPSKDTSGKPRYVPAAIAPNSAKKDTTVPMVSIIVLNWNGDLLLNDFFASIVDAHFSNPFEILFVDHGSEDDSLEIARSFSNRLPIRIIERKANYSFSASNNYAASLAKGSLLLFANNDLVLQHDCVARMAKLLESDTVGVVGAKLFEPLKDGQDSWSLTPHHEGVHFKVVTLPGTKQPYYSPQEINGSPEELSKTQLCMPVVTGALMMCRKVDYAAVGGFNEDYFYGLEDVDFCLKLTRRLGKSIICDLDSTAIHNCSATRAAKFVEKGITRFYTPDLHAKNRATYMRRFGRGMPRTILQGLVESSQFYREQPLRVTFAVTEADLSTAAGDYYTAFELGIWLNKKFGWQVFFVNMGHHALPGTDVLVVMRHDYALRKVTDANPGLISIAWVRNRVDQWLAAPEFHDYDLVMASSHKAIEHIKNESGRNAVHLPIATNPVRFSPEMADPTYTSDVVFTGSYHAEVRGAVVLLDPAKVNFCFAIYGYNWDKYPRFSDYWRGSVRYDSLGKAYASSKVVLDDSHPVTRNWNSLNSRIFDAIACGKVVVSNCVDGAKELFGDKLPTFRTREELDAVLNDLLTDDRKREALAAELHQEVLTKHTYGNRADTMKEALREFVQRPGLRFAIKIGVPSVDECEQWGDWHFALGIKRALEKQGHRARVDIWPHWESGLSAADEVVIVLRGLSRYKPLPTAINIMWLISHPDDVSVAEMREYDHVFIASEPHAQRMIQQLGARVSPLLQCTDPALFYPDPQEDLDLPGALFVGNSRGQRREVVQRALDAQVDFGVIGSGWHGMLPEDLVRGQYIPNSELRRYYSSAKVVLNDHWPDMRDQGFISNRIYDAGACGAAIVTDQHDECKRLFGDHVQYYSDTADLKTKVEAASSRSSAGRKRRAALREHIVGQHTFDHRVQQILKCIEQLRAEVSSGN